MARPERRKSTLELRGQTPPPQIQQPEVDRKGASSETRARRRSTLTHRSPVVPPVDYPMTFYLDPLQAARVHNALTHTKAETVPSDFFADVVMAEVERLEREENNGQPFPA